MMDISVLIVNYNTADLVKNCIASVLNQRDANYEIIVVDNASHDNSLDVLKQFGENITLIANDNNIGFGRANNQGYRLSTGRYLFLLNPDAVLLTDHDLYNAVQYMNTHPTYGLIGTKVLDSNGNNTESASRHYPRQKQTSADFSTLPGEWATVLGASMIIRRDVFDEVGGFDESFFLYAEETDLCLRIRKLGFMIGYVDQIAVKHVGGASERKNPPKEVVRKKKRGKYLFYSKHYPKKDVLKIVKNDLTHARWHLFRLWIQKKLFGLSDSQQTKYERHKVSCEAAKEFLRDH